MRIIIRLNVILMSVLLVAHFALADPAKKNGIESENSRRDDELAMRFQNPPDSARPGVYWYFMDGNLNREEMTADLEAMKDAGIGNLVFLEVNVGVPRGPADFMSEYNETLWRHEAASIEIRFARPSYYTDCRFQKMQYIGNLPGHPESSVRFGLD